MWNKTSYYSCILLLNTYSVYTLSFPCYHSLSSFFILSITFTQCATKHPGISGYYKKKSSSLLLLLLFLELPSQHFDCYQQLLVYMLHKFGGFQCCSSNSVLALILVNNLNPSS